MATKKISQLDVLAAPADEDYIPIVDAGGTPTSKRVTIATLFNNKGPEGELAAFDADGRVVTAGIATNNISQVGHNHNDIYFTETEITAFLNTVSSDIGIVNTNITNHSAATAPHGATPNNTADRLVLRNSAGGFGAGPVTFSGGTVTVDTPIIDLTQTWNNAATIFTGIKLNVINTTSSASSALIDLQLGGTSLFKVLRTGVVTLSGNIVETQNNRNVPNGYAALDANGDLLGPIIVEASTEAVINLLTLEAGELQFATDTKDLRFHDGVLAGGLSFRGRDLAYNGGFPENIYYETNVKLYDLTAELIFGMDFRPFVLNVRLRLYMFAIAGGAAVVSLSASNGDPEWVDWTGVLNSTTSPVGVDNQAGSGSVYGYMELISIPHPTVPGRIIWMIVTRTANITFI